MWNETVRGIKTGIGTGLMILLGVIFIIATGLAISLAILAGLVAAEWVVQLFEPVVDSYGCAL